jgi:hypothetical protein
LSGADRIEFVRGDRVDDLRGVRDQIRPAVAHPDRTEILQDIEAQARQHDGARALDVLHVTESLSIAFHRGRRSYEDMGSRFHRAAAQQVLPYRNDESIRAYARR